MKNASGLELLEEALLPVQSYQRLLFLLVQGPSLNKTVDIVDRGDHWTRDGILNLFTCAPIDPLKLLSCWTSEIW